MRRRRGNQFKFEKAREMRDNPTLAEEKMYELLYSQVVPNYPQHIFYRQSVKFGYILDFYCPTLRLGIEVDGSVHYGREAYDIHRDAVLARKHIQVYRFRNDEVLYSSQAVATQICQIIQEKTTPCFSQPIHNKRVFSLSRAPWNYCPDCGAKIKNEYVFCGNCGKKLNRGLL